MCKTTIQMTFSMYTYTMLKTILSKSVEMGLIKLSLDSLKFTTVIDSNQFRLQHS